VTVAPLLEEQDFQIGNADLDWQGFVSAYFPASGRHDLRAITAYAACKCSGVVDEQSATEAGRSKRSERTSRPGSKACQRHLRRQSSWVVNSVHSSGDDRLTRMRNPAQAGAHPHSGAS